MSVTQLNPEQCEVLLHENINAETRTTTGASGEEQTTVYTAQEYTLIIPWREGIEDSIKANVSAWTEMARKQELEELLPQKAGRAGQRLPQGNRRGLLGRAGRRLLPALCADGGRPD